METWKLLSAITVVLVVFGVVASVTDLSLSPPVVVGLLIAAAIFSAVFYFLSVRGYRIGQTIGEEMREREE